MKRFLLIVLLTVTGIALKAQQIESIYFNLYTDSLKKGSWNYINVEGKLNNGKIIPLNATQLQFNSSTGTVDATSLWIDWNSKADSVVVTVSLKSNPTVQKKMTIWIKQKDLQMQAPVQDSVLQQLNERNRKRPKKKQ